jgi:glycosyltransferase involved in cell wall biosynthesis
MQDQISVIIPCYNDGKYIQETIDRLKQQTLACY